MNFPKEKACNMLNSRRLQHITLLIKLTPGTELPMPWGPGDRFFVGPPPLFRFPAAFPVEDFLFRLLPGCLVGSVKSANIPALTTEQYTRFYFSCSLKTNLARSKKTTTQLSTYTLYIYVEFYNEKTLYLFSELLCVG